MDISSIQTQFADELAQIRTIKSPRARKYTADLKKAICDLHADGVPIERIQKQLGLSGGAFKNWFTHPKRKKAAFTLIVFEKSMPKLPLASTAVDLLLIELPSDASREDRKTSEAAPAEVKRHFSGTLDRVYRSFAKTSAIPLIQRLMKFS